jgi:hypothetical protein
MDIGTMILTACKALNINKPVRVSLVNKFTKKMKNTAGVTYTIYRKNKIQYFKVTICLNECLMSGYSVSDTVLHELVHVSMIENNKFDDDFHHNAVFQDICEKLKIYMQEMGFTVGVLYSPDIDKS